MKFASLLTHYFMHYLSNQALSALQQMSPSLLLSQSRLSHFTHHICLSSSVCPVLLVSPPFCLSYPFDFALAILSWQSCCGSPVWQSFPNSPVLSVLSAFSVLSCPVLHVLFHLSCSTCTILPVLLCWTCSVILFCLSCSDFLILPVLLCLSCSCLAHFDPSQRNGLMSQLTTEAIGLLKPMLSRNQA